MNASTKLDIFFVLAALFVACSASPIVTNMERLRSRLATIEVHHSELYDSIRTKRFNNPNKVLPPQTITGMEPVRETLRFLDGDDVLEPVIVYTLLYKSLLIFEEAFRHIAIAEIVLEDRVKALDELEAMLHPTFHSGVTTVYHDIRGLSQNLRHIMALSAIPIPNFAPTIVLEREVDGKICDPDCSHERNLYIHQQLDYFINRMAHSIATLNEERSS